MKKKVERKKLSKKVKKSPLKKKVSKKLLVKKIDEKSLMGENKSSGVQQEENKIPKTEKKQGLFSNLSNKAKNLFKRNRKMENLPRASTGIVGFDKMVEGGFEGNSINLVAGTTGSGKTILALQFLLQGLKKGENALYISFEERKEDFFKNMKKFGWDLQKLENSGKFIYLEYSPEKVKMMLDEGGGSIESIVLKNKIKRMVIDSITSFSLLFDDKLSKRQANLSLLDIIGKWNLTTILTVQEDTTKEKTKTDTMEFEADSLTKLYYMKIKNKRQRFIEVVKMRGTNHSKETHSFEIGRGGVKVGSVSKLSRLKK